jgi:polyphosphate kinase
MTILARHLIKKYRRWYFRRNQIKLIRKRSLEEQKKKEQEKSQKSNIAANLSPIKEDNSSISYSSFEGNLAV